jgi:CRP-like cAMP-binding protein
MKQVKYEAGDIIFKEGDPSDFVYKIVSGEVEVFMESGGKTVILGLMRAGEFLGEMGIVDDQTRSASVRAKNQVSMIIYEENEFLRLISRDSVSAEKLILRLCDRLRNVSKKLTEAAVSLEKGGVTGIEGSVRRPQDLLASTGIRAKGSNEVRLTLIPLSQTLIPHLPKEGIQIMKLPYSVGRLPVDNELESAMPIDLQIPDSVPFRLSRQHFALYQNPDGCGILDLGSALGTGLNEDFLGHNFAKDFGYLKMGKNKVTAGGMDSPFAFNVWVESV